jgi:hypothetical protein
MVYKTDWKAEVIYPICKEDLSRRISVVCRTYLIES